MEIIKGNILKIFESSPEPMVMAHGCNCQGAFGSGIAGQIRNAFQEVYLDYARYVRFSGLTPDELLGRINPVNIRAANRGKPYIHNKWIVNGFTQLDFNKDHANLERVADPRAIEKVLINSIRFKNAVGIESNLHIPFIGVGLGGLEFYDLKKAIINAEYIMKGNEITLVEFDNTI